RGRLVIAGDDVEQLADSSDFETAAARVLIAGGLPPVPDMRGALAKTRAAAWEALPRLGDALDAPDGMDALRAAMAHLRSSGDEGVDALPAIGAAPVFAAAGNRRHAGEAPVAPNAVLGHAADYLRMSRGVTPSDDAVRALDAYLVTVID